MELQTTLAIIVLAVIGHTHAQAPGQAVSGGSCFSCDGDYMEFGFGMENYFTGKFFTRYGTVGNPLGSTPVRVQYGDYYGFDFNDIISMTDVCFTSQCVTSYRVIAYDEYWCTLFDQQIDIQQYYDDYYSRNYYTTCLNFEYEYYYDFCIEDVKHVRVYFFMDHDPGYKVNQVNRHNSCRDARVKDVLVKGCKQYVPPVCY